MVWSLEFSPQLRSATKTTKICEIWIDNELMNKQCAYTCAAIANNIYSTQGTDPDICAQTERELAQISGGDTNSFKYSLLEAAAAPSQPQLLRRQTQPPTPPPSQRAAEWVPSHAPPAEYLTRQ
jgi:hypothetical protein